MGQGWGGARGEAVRWTSWVLGPTDDLQKRQLLIKPQHGHLQTVRLEVPKFWSPPRSPSYSLGPLSPPCFTVSLLGKHRASPKWYPDPALGTRQLK